MKNKPSGNTKGQQKIINASKPPMNVKNRDQLRKKLKGLLDKQVLSPLEKAGQKIYLKANSSHTTEKKTVPFNKKSNLIKSKSAKQNGKDKNVNGTAALKQKETKKNRRTEKLSGFNLNNEGRKNVHIKSNISKKNEKFVPTCSNGNSKDNDVSLKRKLKKRMEHLKCTKTSEHSQTSDDNLKTKKQKPDNGKGIEAKPVKSAKKKTDKSESNITFGAPKKGKPSKTKAKLVLSQKSAKREQYTQGRGPLRPQTSESEFDADLDSSPRQLKRKPKQIINSESEIDSSPKTKHKISNTEQALVRAKNDFEGSCVNSNQNYDSCFDFLFDKTYVDSEETTSCSFDSQSEYTEEESEFEYSDEESDLEYGSKSSENESSEDYENEYFNDYSSEFSGSDDESYQPPGNLPEDIYIAKGTAVKYDISTDDIGFDSDTQYAQIIEMPSKATDQKRVSSIKKPLPLASKQNQINKTTSGNDEESMFDSDDSCPELIPIENIDDTASYYSSSSNSSHSCCSSCDCGSCDEIVDISNSEQQYKPMTPEVIKAKAEAIPEMETFFDTKSNEPKPNATPNSVLEEVCSSYSNNPLLFKVYTINNVILNNDSISSESSKTCVERPKKVVDTHSENSTKKINETPQKIMDETIHVSKKAKIAPASPTNNELPSQKSIGTTTEQSSQYNKTDNNYSTKSSSSQPKTPIRTMFFNAINCNHVIVLLKDPLYIYGTVKLKLLAGNVEIFGYNPKRNEVLEIFSPRGYSSLKIEPSHSEVNVPLNEKEVLSLTPFFIRSDLEEILKQFDPTQDAVLMLERNDQSKNVNMLKKYMVEDLFPNMNSIQSDRPFYTSEFLLRCIMTPNTDNALFINPDWNTIRVQNNSKMLIIGGKSVGKSTLARYLINKNLNKHQKILLVDLDIGQPEMFVPQTVSATVLTEPLLGPGYFFNKQPDKSFLVGHISIINSLEAYIESLKALFEYCNANSDYKDIPWIVNTMGYNKGFGDELISVICSLLQPSNIVQFESDREINDFDIIMIKDNVKSIERNIIGDMFKPSKEFVPQHQLTLIRSFIPRSRGSKNEMTMKPKDMRLAMVLSRLSSTLTGHAEWMTDVKPLCASIDDLNIIKLGDDQLGKEDLVKTLVGNLVYLCRMEPGKPNECFGIGIVRGVDYPLRQIYLLPTIPLDLLTCVNCLAICGIPLPSSILLKQGPKVKGVASYVYNTLDEAASMYIKQMYNKPQQFPTGKRKSIVK